MSTFYQDYVNGNDYSGGDSWTATKNSSDGVTNGTTTVTSASGGFTGLAGRYIWIGSDASTQLYWGLISSVTNDTTIVVASTIATGSGRTIIVGRAWKTMTTGATAARLTAGDTIRIAKSADPTSLGIAAQWTSASKTVTLASALTANIDMGEAAWTASANVTATANAARKEGSYSANLSIASGFTTGTVAYKATGTLDLSAYQQISFWIRASTAQTASRFRIDLCSDAAGATPVNQLTITQTLEAGQWMPITINYGGALSSSIESVRLYASSDPGTTVINLDDIIACLAPGNTALTLESLIGKNASGETFWPIQSINGTTVCLDHHTNCDASASARGYYGTTESVTTYKRETIKTVQATANNTQVQAVLDSGTVGVYITYSGGWDTGSTTQNGETWFDGRNGWGYGIYATGRAFIRLERLCMTRYYYPYYWTGCDQFIIVDAEICGGGHAADNTDNIAHYSCSNFEYYNLISVASGDSGVNWRVSVADKACDNTRLYDCKILSNFDDGLDPTAGGHIYAYNCLFANHPTGDVDVDNLTFVELFNCQPLSSTELAAMPTSVVTGSYVASHRHDGVADRHKTWYGFSGYGEVGIIGDHITMGQAASWARGGTGLCLVLDPRSSTASRWLTYEFLIPVTAATSFQLSMYVRKTSAGATCTMNCTIFDSDDNATKLLDAQSVTLTDSWAQYLSTSCNPTDTGFCRVLLRALDGGTTGDIGIDDVSVV